MEILNISGAALQTFPEISNRVYENVDASWNHIRVLWDDELPANVQTLTLEGNHISTDGLPQRWPNSIQSLNLSRNYITSMSDVLHWPTNLRVLNISYNSIVGIVNCRNFPSTLEDLDISFTDITSIVDFPRNLKVFTAISTCLHYIPSKCPDTFTKCIVSDTRKLRKNGLPNYWGSALEHLELHNLKLREFPRNLPPSLKFLNLSKNRIQEICDVSKFPPNLHTLHIGENRIFKIPAWFSTKLPRMCYTIQNNLLTVVPRSPNCLIAFPQMIGSRYTDAAARIQLYWRSYRMGSPFRSWYRISKLKNELLALAMCPERAGRYEDISPEWGFVYTYPEFPPHEPHPTKSYVPASDAAQ